MTEKKDIKRVMKCRILPPLSAKKQILLNAKIKPLSSSVQCCFNFENIPVITEIMVLEKRRLFFILLQKTTKKTRKNGQL